MKNIKTLLTLIFFLPLISATAQTVDSVKMEAGYSNDVYYSFATGEVKKIANNTWDLAFRTGFRTDGILINSISSSTSPRSTRLFLYPKGDTSAWSTFDTSGMATWVEYQNSDSSWEFGAFNRGATGFPDFSWGVYNQVTKVVEGDSLYLLEITNGNNKIYKKLLIQDKNFGVWHFKYANIDGSNEVSEAITASNANAKLLDYYSIVDGMKIDREPDSTKYWDIVFKRYHELLPPTFDTYYPVMGIWSKKDVRVAQVNKTNVATFDYKTLAAADYKLEANIIGSDWKNFDMNVFQWVLEDSLAYYVKTTDGAIWRIVFTEFGGTSNGKTVFNKTKLQPALSTNTLAPIASFGVYPNPTVGNLEVVFENRVAANNTTLSIFNLAGKKVFSQEMNSNEGFHANTIDISALSTGVYVVSIESEGQVLTQKLIKQ